MISRGLALALTLLVSWVPTRADAEIIERTLDEENSAMRLVGVHDANVLVKARLRRNGSGPGECQLKHGHNDIIVKRPEAGARDVTAWFYINLTTDLIAFLTDENDTSCTYEIDLP